MQWRSGSGGNAARDTRRDSCVHSTSPFVFFLRAIHTRNETGGFRVGEEPDPQHPQARESTRAHTHTHTVTPAHLFLSNTQALSNAHTSSCPCCTYTHDAAHGVPRAACPSAAHTLRAHACQPPPACAHGVPSSIVTRTPRMEDVCAARPRTPGLMHASRPTLHVYEENARR